MATAPLTEIRQRKILVAQRAPLDRAFLRLFLELIGGYEVSETADGVGLIKQLRQKPDLIVMDTAPEGNFLRALELIRRNPGFRRIPILVYSYEQGKFSECVRKGADGFVVNPSSPSIFLGKIWKLLGDRSRQEATAAGFIGKYRRDIGKIDHLPTLPTVYAEVDRLCKDPDVGAAELTEVIEADPPLTLKLLNLANSAFFGFSRQIKSVHDAISLLGNQTVRNTILNITIFDATRKMDATAGLDKNQFWMHAAGVGSAARFLSGKLDLGREESFTAGIVHDMGKIVLDTLYVDFYTEVLSYVKEASVSILAAEEEVLGLSHSQVGLELAANWNLPVELTEAIAHHHRPARAKEDPQIASLIHLGDAICRKLGVGSGGDSSAPEMAPSALEHLQITAEQAAEWEPEIQEAIGKDRSILSILKS